MKIIVKQLQGGECTLEVVPTTLILEIKHLVAQKLGIPVEQQKLLLLGRTLIDDQMVQSYPSIREGSKLNLVVKKPEGLYEASIKYFKGLGMTETEATNTAKRLMKIVQDKFNKLSWDDIDRLSQDCLMDEGINIRPAAENENECDEMYNCL